MRLPTFALGTSLVLVLASPVLLQAQSNQSHHFALLVGVREYEHQRLPELKYSENDVLDMAKLEGGSVKLPSETVDVREEVQTVLHELERDAAAKEIQLRLMCSDGLAGQRRALAAPSGRGTPAAPRPRSPHRRTGTSALSCRRPAAQARRAVSPAG